jgi:hypothetical protein
MLYAIFATAFQSSLMDQTGKYRRQIFLNTKSIYLVHTKIYIIQVYTWYILGVYTQKVYTRHIPGIWQFKRIYTVYTWHIPSRIWKYTWYIRGIWQCTIMFLVYTWYIPTQKNIHGIYLKYIRYTPIQKYIPGIYRGYTRHMSRWWYDHLSYMTGIKGLSFISNRQRRKEGTLRA